MTLNLPSGMRSPWQPTSSSVPFSGFRIKLGNGRREAQTGGKQAEEKSETLQTVNKFVVPSVWQRSDATRVQANDRMKGTVF